MPGRVSSSVGTLEGSAILKIAGEIRQRIAAGEKVCNLTVGDFDPKMFRIPASLEQGITQALARGETNYPPGAGLPSLREAVVTYYERSLGLRYPVESVIITSGSRPGVYGTYCTLVDPGDRVVYPAPSWNNNYYCHMVGAVADPVATTAEESFMPSAEVLAPHLRGARMLALNSPLNPCGTAFTAESLGAICDLVLEENARRGKAERPLYLMYDQVYWQLTFGDTVHVDPVNLRPEMARYTILIDGISKAFAATGVRVGWVLGPTDVMEGMNNFLSHVGTWAPRAEQVATAALLLHEDGIADFRAQLLAGVQARLDALYQGINALKGQGFSVDAIAPQGAIYLSARFNLYGKTTPQGDVLKTSEDIRGWLLREAGLAVVPFHAFGAEGESGWCRLSVGAVSLEEIAAALPRLGAGLAALR
ncbi:MAG: aminotransferase class I/II-fold pyridoxal phosphate-dependent enzyme [Gemmatimonadetes bacterium]|nr:aminotransferase class I/II-fold pyridoxal phosphate-dependent enzyme [Gemmatimonadota bacterium]MBK6457478.1 aminotransferase class I/II-fold pyridoxal phosphate-dependent enzyme [Gemmatimonadota bacterium]MBK6842689.1 aminotransferase class I/II-fold pyridoxal phosphate-dependent enzyme [Gemmatimonadota bacterium]MBK7831113.1 aminotransferase class I/II-fold pyridoxal phosphate-dependent enzyme [Gemmatimonadota bacterium]MBK9408759.1 aminotransferase class I/II-fold pyridoxal phosphate-dep